jgi:hypothetical protein
MRLCAAALLFALVAQAGAQPAAPAKSVASLNAAMQEDANAARRYTLFARKADEEGYTEVAKLFRAAAQSELIHQQNHRQAIAALGGKVSEIELVAVAISSTRQNLEAELSSRSLRRLRDAEPKQTRLFARALYDLGSNPPTEYYVGLRTGDVVTEAPAHPAEEYVHIQ